MNPALLHTISGAKSIPMPIDEPKTIGDLARMLERERANTAAGKSTYVFRAPAWTLAECAQACGGMDNRHFWALRYSYALDDSVRSRLWSALFQWALDRRERERWPVTVRTVEGKDRKFLDDLVLLMLIEERAPWRFVRKPNDPDIKRTVMGVAEHTWRRNLSPAYEAIRDEYLGWLGSGKHLMRKRLENPA
jgi:hypothetical protein